MSGNNHRRGVPTRKSCEASRFAQIFADNIAKKNDDYDEEAGDISSDRSDDDSDQSSDDFHWILDTGNPWRNGFEGWKLSQKAEPVPDSYWDTLKSSYHEVIPLSYWVSLGKGDEYAARMFSLQGNLESWIRKLCKHRLTWGEMYVLIDGTETDADEGGETVTDIFLHYNERLHSRWSMLFHAMGGSICWSSFCVESIEMPKALLDLMGSAMKKAERYRRHMYSITLDNTSAGSDGDGFFGFSGFLESNTYVHALRIIKNTISSEEVASSFSNSVHCHKHLERLYLEQNGIGRNTNILSSIIAACSNLDTLELNQNSIQSKGAIIICDFLASNPHLKSIHLYNNYKEEPDSNKFEDHDVDKFVGALKKNTRLKLLVLGNSKDFSQAGSDALAKAFYDDSNLNAIVDCNHSCGVDGPPAIGNRALSISHKLFQALLTSPWKHPCKLIHMAYLDAITVPLMPKFLKRIQFIPEKFSISKLNMVFEVVREWKLPFLFQGLSAKNYHPPDVTSCMDGLVSAVSSYNGDCSQSFHRALLPPPLIGEYDVVLPVTDSRGVMLSYDEIDGLVVFMGYRHLPNGCKGPAESSNLIGNGDIMIGINGVCIVGKPFHEVVNLMKASLSFLYLRFVNRDVQMEYITHRRYGMTSCGRLRLESSHYYCASYVYLPDKGCDCCGQPEREIRCACAFNAYCSKSCQAKDWSQGKHWEKCEAYQVLLVKSRMTNIPAAYAGSFH